MTPAEVADVVELDHKFHGNTYHLLGRNCNVFVEAMCAELTGCGAAAQVNRLARIAVMANQCAPCILPASVWSPRRRLWPLGGFVDDSDDDSDDDAPLSARRSGRPCPSSRTETGGRSGSGPGTCGDTGTTLETDAGDVTRCRRHAIDSKGDGCGALAK